MSLSQLFLILTLLAWSTLGLGWLSFDQDVIYWLSLATAIFMMLERLSIWSWSTPSLHRRKD